MRNFSKLILVFVSASAIFVRFIANASPFHSNVRIAAILPPITDPSNSVAAKYRCMTQATAKYYQDEGHTGESSWGISPQDARRTGRETLASSGSR